MKWHALALIAGIWLVAIVPLFLPFWLLTTAAASIAVGLLVWLSYIMYRLL